MLVPGGYQSENPNQLQDLFTDILVGVQADTVTHERNLRHVAYTQIDALVAPFLSTQSDSAEALHAHPVDLDGTLGNRMVFMSRDRVPGHGTLLRVIVNDVMQEPFGDGRKLTIRDFMLSSTQKAMTFQHSSVTRGHHDSAWPVPANRGPLMQKLHDSLHVTNGSDYAVHIPKTKGYPVRPFTLVEQRVLLEALADDLNPLSGVTLEPGHPSKLGILS